MLVKKFKTSQHLAKLQARKLTVSQTLCAWHCPVERRRTRQISWVWLLLAVLRWFWLGLDNYQTGVNRFWLAN